MPGADSEHKKPGRQRSRTARYIRRAVFTLLGLITTGVLGFVILYLLTPIPNAQSAALAAGSTFYYSDGKTVIAHMGTNRKILASIDQVPVPVRQAVIAAENRTFYTDPGVSLQGSARAIWSTVSGGQVQGGSTITQQMVRNYYNGLSQEKSVVRKFKEVMISMKVGNEKSKDWILLQYLNTIYFGRDAFGIEAAAHAYFNVSAKDLTPSQGAYLAAAIQQPSLFGIAAKTDMPLIETRWKYVVNGMVTTKAITQAQADAMKFAAPVRQSQSSTYGGANGYMVFNAINELKNKRGYTDGQISSLGLKVVTTFDKDLMAAAKSSVESLLPSGLSPQVMTGLVSVNPANGEVVAFYGGKDYLKDEVSSSFGAQAQAGSGFKPYALAAALENGMSLSDTMDGSSPVTVNGKNLSNDNGDQFGQVNLVKMTQNSINTAYIRLGQQIGEDKIQGIAERLGIPAAQLTANGANTAATFPLGVADVSVVQQAGAYAAFANDGVFHAPHVIKYVSDSAGAHKVTISEPGVRAFSKQTARDATYAMTKVVSSGTGLNAQLDDGRPQAGKTGTTSGGAALWFNGYVPQMSTSVGMFRSDSTVKSFTVPGYSSYGGSLSAIIWKSYMTKAIALKNYPATSFGAPSSYTGSYNSANTPTPNPTPTATHTPTPTHTVTHTPIPIPIPIPTHVPTHVPTQVPSATVTPALKQQQPVATRSLSAG